MSRIGYHPVQIEYDGFEHHASPLVVAVPLIAKLKSSFVNRWLSKIVNVFPHIVSVTGSVVLTVRV
ncbi:hypothetical protein D3C80_2044240 [compost metagenome]